MEKHGNIRGDSEQMLGYGITTVDHLTYAKT